MAIKFSISSMLQLTACIAVLFASYGLLPTLPGFLPGFERLIFTCCLAGAYFPSLVISLCRLPVTSRYCWQSIFISTIILSWIGFFLCHRWCQSQLSVPISNGLEKLGAGGALLLLAVICSFIIAMLVATLVNRGILRLSGRGTILKNHRRKIAMLKKANLRMSDLLFRLQNNTDDEASRIVNCVSENADHARSAKSNASLRSLVIINRYAMSLRQLRSSCLSFTPYLRLTPPHFLYSASGDLTDGLRATRKP